MDQEQPPKKNVSDLMDELAASLEASLTPEEMQALSKQAATEMAELRWIPNPGAQELAFQSRATETLYGGKAGGGKTELEIGLALTRHKRSLLLRRLNKEVHMLVDRCKAILGHSSGYNGQDKRWHLPDGRLLMFGGCQHPDDAEGYKGEPKDLICFDEASEFLESQVDLIVGWLRSSDPDQRCRIVFATNPPTGVNGEWLLERFAPWIDDAHSMYPQAAGKLLYFRRNPDDSWFFAEEPFMVDTPSGPRPAQTRTYVPADLADNPDYYKSGYSANLAGMPEELRRRYLEGIWKGATRDEDNQVILGAWVDAAMDRWTPEPPHGVPMTSVGVDVAVSRDRTVLACRYDQWFAPLISVPGHLTPDGQTTAGLVAQHMKHGAQINIDMGGGWGGSTYDHLRQNGVNVMGVNPAAGSSNKTPDGKLKFVNMRSELMWGLRWALDPSSGYKLALPRDSALKRELIAAHWKLTLGGILIEPKDAIKGVLGRSPDLADALALAWFSGSIRARRDNPNAAGYRRSSMNPMSINPGRGRYGGRGEGGSGSGQSGHGPGWTPQWD